MKNIKFMYLYLLYLRDLLWLLLIIECPNQNTRNHFFITRLNLKLINITIDYKSLFMSHGAPKLHRFSEVY